MFYYSIFCDVDIVIFISGGENGVSLSFCEKGGVALSRENIRKLEEILSSGEFNRTSGADCHNVSVIESIEKMYEKAMKNHGMRYNWFGKIVRYFYKLLLKWK